MTQKHWGKKRKRKEKKKRGRVFFSFFVRFTIYRGTHADRATPSVAASGETTIIALNTQKKKARNGRRSPRLRETRDSNTRPDEFFDLNRFNSGTFLFYPRLVWSEDRTSRVRNARALLRHAFRFSRSIVKSRREYFYITFPFLLDRTTWPPLPVVFVFVPLLPLAESSTELNGRLSGKHHLDDSR